MSRRGPAANLALSPAVLVAFIDDASQLVTDGIPRRQRLHINCRPVSANDARVIRRWRSGSINGVTKGAAEKLLATYGMTLTDLARFSPDYVLRGHLN